MIKKLGFLLIVISSFLYSFNSNIQMQIENASPQNMITYLLANGAPYNTVISNTDDLKLQAVRIYIYNNKKALLIKVINKTSKYINVSKEVNYGYPVPKILPPLGTGWLIVTNFPLLQPYKYNVKSFDAQLFEIITQKKLVDIEPYFFNDIVLVKLKFPNVAKYVSLNDFNLEFLGKGPFIAFTRIDREIDDQTNRWGMFVNGFLRASGNFWVPYTFYFIIKQGKIVKIIYIDKFLNFEQFKSLVYTSSH